MQKVLKLLSVKTPLGSMVVIADDEALYFLEFADRERVEKQIHRLQKADFSLIEKTSIPAEQIKTELALYFSHKLQTFKTPLFLHGSLFQQKVWQELRKIPYGQTQSYADIASALKKPTAFRAVALANGANRFPIVIPCHRVIYKNGDLGGYGGGLNRKKWLLDHERR